MTKYNILYIPSGELILRLDYVKTYYIPFYTIIVNDLEQKDIERYKTFEEKDIITFKDSFKDKGYTFTFAASSSIYEEKKVTDISISEFEILEIKK